MAWVGLFKCPGACPRDVHGNFFRDGARRQPPAQDVGERGRVEQGSLIEPVRVKRAGQGGARGRTARDWLRPAGSRVSRSGLQVGAIFVARLGRGGRAVRGCARNAKQRSLGHGIRRHQPRRLHPARAAPIFLLPLARTFRTLLSCAATACSKIFAVVSAAWSVRAIGKTAAVLLLARISSQLTQKHRCIHRRLSAKTNQSVKYAG